MDEAGCHETPLAHLSIDQAADLREAEVYPAFVAHFGGELRDRALDTASQGHGRTDSGRSRLFVRVDRWVGSAASENVSDTYVAGQGR